MMRRMTVASFAATLIVTILAGCGGSEASPSPSAAAASEAPATVAPATMAPATEAPASAATDGTMNLVAACGAVGVRKGPATTDAVLVRLPKGAKVRVVETVTGDPYTAGACGASGDDWLKIDRVNGKSVKSLYGVSFGYAAGGFFQ